MFLPLSHPILYSFRRCPYAMRARMGLYASNKSVLIREVDLKNKPGHMLSISPKATVPVLYLDEHNVIDESLDIIYWALKQNDPLGYLDIDMNEFKNLIELNDGSFKSALDRYKYPSRYPDEDCSGARDICESFFEKLDTLVKKHDGNLLKSECSIADISIFPFIRQCAHVDKDWFQSLPFAALQQWLNKNLESDQFKAIMKKYKAWEDQDPEIFFGLEYA